MKIKESIFDNYSKILEEDIILCRREVNRFMGANDELIYTDKGFTSTSIFEYAKKEIYGDELNYILVPKGTEILYLEGLTTSLKDYEVLFKPRVKLNFVENLTNSKKVWILS